MTKYKTILWLFFSLSFFYLEAQPINTEQVDINSFSFPKLSSFPFTWELVSSDEKRKVYKYNLIHNGVLFNTFEISGSEYFKDKRFRYGVVYRGVYVKMLDEIYWRTSYNELLKKTGGDNKIYTRRGTRAGNSVYWSMDFLAESEFDTHPLLIKGFLKMNRSYIKKQLRRNRNK